MTRDEKLKEAANGEAQIAYIWAESKLRTDSPPIAYEYGVKAGFEIGANWQRSQVLSIIIKFRRMHENDEDWELSDIISEINE